MCFIVRIKHFVCFSFALTILKDSFQWLRQLPYIFLEKLSTGNVISKAVTQNIVDSARDGNSSVELNLWLVTQLLEKKLLNSFYNWQFVLIEYSNKFTCLWQNTVFLTLLSGEVSSDFILVAILFSLVVFNCK